MDGDDTSKLSTAGESKAVDRKVDDNTVEVAPNAIEVTEAVAVARMLEAVGVSVLATALLKVGKGTGGFPEGRNRVHQKAR